MSTAAVSQDERGVERVGNSPRRRWLSAAGVLMVLAAVAPPMQTLAQRYVFAETIQFVIFAVAGPALIVLGSPWRLLRLSRSGTGSDGVAAGLADRLAERRRQHPSFRRAGAFLLAFMALTLLWRLPPAMNALVSQPTLVVVEMVTLLLAGVGLWLELAPSSPFAPRLPRPQRATIAALAMWFLWGIAYAIGMNPGAVFQAYGELPGRAVGLMADQEIAVGIMWVVAGGAFIPIVLYAMLSWLTSDNSDEEVQRIVRDENQRAVVRGWAAPKNRRQVPS